MRKNLKRIFLIFGMLLSLSAFGQKEGAIWYFGYNAGLDFTRHYPRPITDGKIYTREGVATISTSEGDLLFYTDGSTVWNKSHQVMDNGFGLYGSVSSTQSSIIVPTPNKQYEYYIFTVDVIDGTSSKGMNYSVVDMVQNNRLGRVFPKNQPVPGNTVEKIAVVKHDNGVDYWIIGHEWNTNKFYVSLLTKTGLSTNWGGEAQQRLGSVHENTDPNDDFNRGAVGYMKTSPKGDYLALAIESKNIFELFSFDSKTGKLGFLATLPAGEEGRPNDAIHAAYGVEFSPTSNYLYGTTRKGGKIYRWNITHNTEQKIRSTLEVLNPDMKNITCGAIQLAFNGKIYVCFAGKQYLGVINSPTQENCKFVQQGASLIDNVAGVGGKAYYGLPTFLPDFFKAAEFYYDNTCQLDTTLFYLSTIYGLGGSPTWKIYSADGAQFFGNAQVNQKTFEGSFIFTEPGDYIAELEVEQNGVPIKQRREIHIHALPELNFADTTVLCATKTVILDAGDGAFYKWSDNVNLLERNRVIGVEGLYSVRVIHNNGCVKYDTTQVVEKPLPIIKEIISVKASCGYQNGSITLVPEDDISAYAFVWKDYPDSTTNNLRGLGRGIYEVDVISTITGCTLTKKVTVSEQGAPPVEISPSIDGTICPGTELILTADGAQDYSWSFPDGAITREITVAPYATTTYIVEGYSEDAQGNKCSGFGEITIDVHPFQPPELGSDREVCAGEEVKFDGGELYISWNWSTGESERYINLVEDQKELILEIEDKQGCVMSDTVSVTFKPLPVVNLGPDITLCKGDPIFLDAGMAEEYLWNTGDTVQNIEIDATGHYSVLVTSDGCSGSDDVIIQLNSPDSLRIDSVNVQDITCYGANNGEMLVFAKGEGTFYEFSLDQGTSWKANNGIFEQLAPDVAYNVQVREDSSCTASWLGDITFHEPERIQIDFKLVSPSCDNCQDGQIILDVKGGTPPYEYLWSNFESNKSRKDLGLGEYSVSITDAAYCKDLTSIQLVMGFGAVSIPNAFTPNGDSHNDTWIIQAVKDYPDVIITIFDRSGKVVFESPAGYPEPWNGKLNNKYLPMGTYYYVIKLNDILDLVNGDLTIIR